MQDMFRLIIDWVYSQFHSCDTEHCFQIATKMYDVWQDDREYWSNAGFWKMYDASKVRSLYLLLRR